MFTVRPSLFAFGATSLLTLPFWLDTFGQRQTPLGSSFAANHHQLPFVAQLDYAAGLIVMACAGALIWSLLRFTAKWSQRAALVLADATAALMILVVCNYVRTGYLHNLNAANLKILATDYPWLSGIMLLLLVTAGWFGLRQLRSTLRGVMVVSLGIGVVIMCNALLAMTILGSSSLVSSTKDFPLAEAVIRDIEKPRVVWMLFDEMDYRLGFEARPADLQLPHFDALRAKAFSATNAYTPASGTIDSMSSVSLRRPVKAEWSAWGSIVIKHPETATPIKWSNLSTMFSEIQGKGRNLALLGQQIPYCRLFSDVSVYCFELGNLWQASTKTPLSQVPKIIQRIVFLLPIMNRLLVPERFTMEWQYRTYISTLDAATHAAADLRNDFVFVHWNVPHAPYVWDRHSRSFTSPSSDPKRYPDNMALADRMLGKILDALSAGNADDHTTVIVSSDHAWGRAPLFDGGRDTRVPFIAKFPGSTGTVHFNDRLSTMMTGPIVDAILDGNVTSAESLERFIREHQSALLASPPPIRQRRQRAPTSASH